MSNVVEHGTWLALDLRLGMDMLLSVAVRTDDMVEIVVGAHKAVVDRDELGHVIQMLQMAYAAATPEKPAEGGNDVGN